MTIAAVGEYRITGTLSEGQIVVDTGEDAVNVTLILDGVSVTNPEGPALWIKQAKNGELCYEYYDEAYNNFAIIDMTIRDNRLVGIDILKNLN